MNWDTLSAMTKTNAARTTTDEACAKRSQWLAAKGLELEPRRHRGSFESERPAADLLVALRLGNPCPRRDCA